MRLKRGITLLQTVTVSVILLAVTTITWLAFGRGSESDRIQARIESDLHEITTAINVYRKDNDGGLPLSFNTLGMVDSLPPSVPRRYPAWPRWSKYSPFDGGSWPGSYFYTMNVFAQRYFRGPDAVNHPDIETIPIVKAPFFVRKTGLEPAPVYSLRIGGHVQMVQGYAVLGGSLDGSVHWGPWFEPYEDELAHNYYKILPGAKD